MGFRNFDEQTADISIDDFSIVEVTDTDNDGVYNDADDYANDAARDYDGDEDGIAELVYELDGNNQRILKTMDRLRRLLVAMVLMMENYHWGLTQMAMVYQTIYG